MHLLIDISPNGSMMQSPTIYGLKLVLVGCNIFAKINYTTQPASLRVIGNSHRKNWEDNS